MQLKSLLALALAATVSSTPLGEPEMSLATRGKDPCDGGRNYCGWFDKKKDQAPSCKCPSGQKWDAKKRKCTCPPLPKPKVGKKEKAICARSKDEYRDYDENDELCANDGQTVVIVVEIVIEVKTLEPKIEEECAKPKCAVGQKWDADKKKCRFPSLPKDKASDCKKKGGRPVCARTPKDFCDFGEKEDYCEDDGVNCLQCVEEKEKPEKVLVKFHADVDVAVKAMGFDCLCDGIGCSLTKAVWSLLGAVDDVVGGLVCGILGLLGLC